MCLLNIMFALLFLMAIKAPSIKDSEYQKRDQKACADFLVIECMKAQANQFSPKRTNHSLSYC